MRRQFLGVYLGVAATVLLVQVLGGLSVRREVIEEADRRVMVTLTPALRMMQHRYARHGDIGEVPPLDGPGPRVRPVPPPRGRGGPHRGPESPGARGRFLQDIMDHHGVDARIEHAVDLDLAAPESRRLRDGDVVMLHDGASRTLVADLGDGEVIALGPLPAAAPAHFLWRRTFHSALILFAIGGVLVLVLRPIETRLERLAEAATDLGHGNLSVRLRDRRADSIGTVSRAFDDMADELGQVIDGQRELLRAVSHELRTPLARLFFLADELRDAEGEDDRRARADRLEVSLSEMQELVDELLQFARLGGGDGLSDVEQVALRPLVDDCVQRAGELRAGIRVERVDGPDIIVAGASKHLRRAVDNILANAVRHATSRVVVSLTREEGYAAVAVDDDGPGIATSDRERVFEPFTRIERSRSRTDGGVGLGLAIVRRVAEAHGGAAEAAESPSGGARVILRLPLSD